MSRILVTGGAGYIGSHVMRRLLEAGHEAWAYDNLSMGHREAVPDDRLFVGDIGDTERLVLSLKYYRVDTVMHLAGQSNVGESVQMPAVYYGENIGNALRLFASMRYRHVNRIVFSSTAATYGVPERMPITEECEQRPINPYGRTKLAIEWALQDYAWAYGWSVVGLRYFNAAGAHPSGDIGEDHNPETHLIPLAIQAAMGQRQHLDVYGTDYDTSDGTCVRDYVHVEDIAAAHVLALDRLKDGRAEFFNLGSGTGDSVRQVIDMVEQVTGRSVPVRWQPRRAGDPAALVAAADNARRVLGWETCSSDLRTIVETAWRWHSGHPRGYGGVVNQAVEAGA